jgi:hypothetical protein
MVQSETREWHAACKTYEAMKLPFNPVSHHHFGNLPGKVGWILLWLIGIPIPILIVLFLIRGCT